MLNAFRIYKGSGQADLERVFTAHYQTNHWRDAESASGSGSTLAYTQHLRKELPLLLANLGVTRMLDAPCGDYNWFQHVERSQGVTYLGGDIVEALVRRNNERYGDSSTQFMKLDITRDPLPGVELWMCRDCLFHLPEREVFVAIHNFLRSNIRWLFTSTHPNCIKNVDIPIGEFRELNLRAAPFCFPEPALMVDDWIEGFPVRTMALWERSQLASALESNKDYRLAVKLR